MPGKKLNRTETDTALMGTIVVCADQLVDCGARSRAVAVVMKLMENAERTIFNPSTQNWEQHPNHELMAKIAMWVITLIDGSPVKRSEVMKRVEVLQAHGSFDAGQVKDPALRARVEGLIAQEQKPASQGKPGGKQPQQTGKAQVVDTEFELAEGAAPAAKAS